MFVFELAYLASSCDTIADRHLQVHEDEIERIPGGRRCAIVECVRWGATLGVEFYRLCTILCGRVWNFTSGAVHFQQFQVHRVVVYEQSPGFRTMLSGSRDDTLFDAQGQERLCKLLLGVLLDALLGISMGALLGVSVGALLDILVSALLGG
jgi:hypothetical protein